jgi:predicted MFS family arabinose efflux permease
MPMAARRRVLWTSAAAVATCFVCYFGLLPVYPSIARDLHVGADTLGLILALGQVLAAALQLPVGMAADRLGRRPFMILGLVLLALAQLVRWQSYNPVVFALGQCGIGLCLPMLLAGSTAAVADAYAHVAGRAQAMGIVFAAGNVGQVAGYLVTGAGEAAFSWRQLCLGFALLPLLLLPFSVRLPEPPQGRQPAPPLTELRQSVRFLLSPGPAALLAIAALVLSGGVCATYLLPFANRSHGVSSATTSILLLPYIAGAVTGAPVVGRIADRVGPFRPFLVMIAGGALATSALALLGPSPLAIVLCYAVIGATVGGGLSLASLQVVQFANRSGAGSGAALGGLRVGQNLGPAVGPALGGLIYVRAGLEPAYLSAAAAMLLGLAVALTLPRASAGAGGPPV